MNVGMLLFTLLERAQEFFFSIEGKETQEIRKEALNMFYTRAGLQFDFHMSCFLVYSPSPLALSLKRSALSALAERLSVIGSSGER